MHREEIPRFHTVRVLERNTNGIVWIIQANVPNDTVITSPPTAALRAYDATNLATELYDSTQATGNRDAAGGSVKSCRRSQPQNTYA